MLCSAGPRARARLRSARFAWLPPCSRSQAPACSRRPSLTLRPSPFRSREPGALIACRAGRPPLRLLPSCSRKKRPDYERAYCRTVSPTISEGSTTVSTRWRKRNRLAQQCAQPLQVQPPRQRRMTSLAEVRRGEVRIVCVGVFLPVAQLVTCVFLAQLSCDT